MERLPSFFAPNALAAKGTDNQMSDSEVSGTISLYEVTSEVVHSMAESTFIISF